MDTLALLFVISAGSIALAVILPIALWQNDQGRATRSANMVNKTCYAPYVPNTGWYQPYQMRPIPMVVREQVIIERRYPGSC